MTGDLVKEMSTPMSPSERMLAVGKQGSDLWLALVEGFFAPKCFREKLPSVEQSQSQGWTLFYSFLSVTVWAASC